MTSPALNRQQIEYSPYLSDIAGTFGYSESLSELHESVAKANREVLLSLKARFSLALAQTEFSSFDEQGRVWSRFADATIDRALQIAWQEAANRHRLTLPKGRIPGLFLLGLGKLGGLDLNFSSDVDLIALYDPRTLPVAENKGQAYIASDVCKRVTQILQPRNAPDFVWRVDWRLRPESSGTGLALSTDKAETFYFFRSLPWHRLALMKARVVGGDYGAGESFLARLEPYIWRRNLDFTTLDELAALKTRINNEHPGLQYERAAPEPITPEASGFNVKLGRGGIREIEFMVNAQQLIHGGKRPSLRVTNTRAALTALSETQLMSASEIETLRDDYKFLRQLENAVQMVGNQHTHILPDGEALQACLSLLEKPQNFNQHVYDCRQRVHLKFSTLFEDPVPAANSVNLSGLSPKNTEIAQSWNSGFTDHGVSLSSHTKFSDLGRRLTTRVMRQESNDAFSRVNDFLKQIGRSEQYFSLLNRHPVLLDKLITPLLHSPHMSKILRQSPHIIDIFIAADSGDLKEQSRFVLTSKDFEHRLEALRRFVNEQLFSAYTKFLENEYSPDQMQTQLTTLAEQTLTLSLQIVCDDLGLEDIPVAILGLGKMGTKTMAPQSDLDLVFLFADEVDTEIATKIVQRLRTTLTVKLREGIAYELDMRLRPSGRSGPPAVKLSAFYDHHMKRAHSWEHIALAPARIVAGDKALGDKVMQTKAEIFARSRDQTAFKKDAFAMFERLKLERITETPENIWQSKLRRGGLMEADYIRSCLEVAGLAQQPTFNAAIEAWSTLQIWERLLGLTGKPISETPQRFSDRLNLHSLTEHQIKLEDEIRRQTDNFFSNVTASPHHEPKPVVWM